MKHDPGVVEVREVNDEQVAYRIRCCGDAATDSWHTMSVHEDHEPILSAAKARVQKTHEAKMQWRERMGR